MASAVARHSFSSPLCCSSRLCSFRPQTLAFGPCRLLPLKSLSTLKKHSRRPIIQTRKSGSRIFAAQSNVFRALQTVYKVGKDGIEAGTNLVPDSVPRPIARVSVAVVGTAVTLFLLKSFLSTAFFILAMMGLIYTAFIALNKDEGSSGGSGGGSGGTTTTSTEESLEEARRIMDKYK